MRHAYHSEQWLPYPVEAVFAFFANPENLPRLMPRWQRAHIEKAAIVAPPSRSSGTSPRLNGAAAGAGTRIKLSFRPFPFSPIRIRWDAEITEFAWNDRFCDHQLRGPFAYWHHCHSVASESRPASNGVSTQATIQGTLLHDKVEYEVPLGSLGEIANALVISRQLNYTFDYRHRRTRELLATAAR